MDYLSQSSFCEYATRFSDSFSCETVYSIDEAFIAGGIHLSEAAPIFFSLAVAVYGSYLVFERRTIFIALTSLLAVGLAVVPYLVYLEVFVAQALCFFCTLMHVSIAGSFTLSAYALTRGVL
ncbi:MAG: hypothetical protein F7C07_03295 [Desulfurococcales archaeon]|nr:hypothetical protein [Desulfurococcales archaeon]